MSSAETLNLPNGLEHFGIAEWRVTPGSTTLHTMLELDRATTDGVVTLFGAWASDGWVNPRKLSYAAKAIDRKLLVPSIVTFETRKPLQGYSMLSGTRDFPHTSITLGSIVFANNDGTPHSHHMPMDVHVPQGITQVPEREDHRIDIPDFPKGVFADRPHIDRVLECAGFLAFNIGKYVREGLANDNFLDEFYRERVGQLWKFMTSYGLHAVEKKGRQQQPSGKSHRFRGIEVMHRNRPYLNVIEADDPAYPIYGKTHFGRGYFIPNRNVRIRQDVIWPLEELLGIGGFDGPVQNLLDK
jgi:hypothetical protein